MADRFRRPGGAGLSRPGTVTRWDPGASSGFITGSDGMSWFASRDDLEAGGDGLPEGTLVTFTGTVQPAPGKRYPRARVIRVREEPGGSPVIAAAVPDREKGAE